jgi:hypothetical protein
LIALTIINKKFLSVNIISSAALWAIWKLKNEMFCKNKAWTSMACLLMRAASLARNWMILCPADRREELSFFVAQKSAEARKPKALMAQ